MIEQYRPLIEAALAHTGGTHDFEDVAQAIADGRMQLWPAADACCVTEIRVYPRKRVFAIFLAAGRMETIHDMIPALEAFAREQNCTACETIGRKGWERRCPEGYRVINIALRKDL